MFKNAMQKLQSFVLMLMLAFSSSVAMLRNPRRLLADCRGDGSMNFLITVVISVAIAAILIGVISAAIPGFWDTVQERITGLLGA